MLLVIAALFVVWQWVLPWAHGLHFDSGGTAPAPTVAAAGPSCPVRVAAALPGGGSGTALVDAYQTEKFLITLCRAVDGQVYYDGQVKGQPADGDNHIVLPAEPTGRGYLARNGSYTYEVRAGRIIVSRGSEVLLDSALQPQPYPS